MIESILFYVGGAGLIVANSLYFYQKGSKNARQAWTKVHEMQTRLLTGINDAVARGSMFTIESLHDNDMVDVQVTEEASQVTKDMIYGQPEGNLILTTHRVSYVDEDNNEVAVDFRYLYNTSAGTYILLDCFSETPENK